MVATSNCDDASHREVLQKNYVYRCSKKKHENARHSFATKQQSTNKGSPRMLKSRRHSCENVLHGYESSTRRCRQWKDPKLERDKLSSSEYPCCLRCVCVWVSLFASFAGVNGAHLHAQEAHTLSITLFFVEHLKVLVDDSDGK